MEANLTYNNDMVRKIGVAGICAAFALGASSCGSGKSQIPGVPSFSVGVVNNTLIASFVASDLNTTVGGEIPIPGLTGATVSMSPDLPTGGGAVKGTLFSFDVDLTQLAGSSATEAGLPDGRPLPDVTGGQLPRWSFQIAGPGSETIYVYLADEAFALFIPIELESNGVTLGATISATITDEHGNTVGKIYAIPSVSSGNSSGLLVLLPFPGQSGSNSTTPGILN
jgi:hypothetical protein